VLSQALQAGSILLDPSPSMEIWEYSPKSNYVDLKKIQTSNKSKIKKFKDAVYFGDIEYLKRNGIGIMKYDSGRFYEGSWKNDLRDGKGYEHFPNGNSYEGEYNKGKPHGNGVFKWNTGEIYDGQWKDGLKQGDGV